MGSRNLKYDAYASDFTKESMDKLNSFVRGRCADDLKSSHDIEELVSNILLDSWIQWTREVPFAQQVFRTASRGSYYQRHRSRKAKNHFELISLPEVYAGEEFGQEVEVKSVIDGYLNPVQKKVFEMTAEQVPQREIAEEIGISDRQVRRVFNQAREVLQQEILRAA